MARSRELLGDGCGRVRAERRGDRLPANARRLMIRGVDLQQWRVFLEAMLYVEWTARVVRTTAREADQVGRRPGNGHNAAERTGDTRHRSHQAHGVRVSRPVEEVVD